MDEQCMKPVGDFGQPFVKWFALCCLTIVYPVCLSVCLYCGHMVECMKMPLGMEVGFGPGHIVLDGDPASPQNGHSPTQCSVHVCCGQMAGWIKMPLGTMPWPRRHCVKWGPHSPNVERGTAARPLFFGPCLVWPNSGPSQQLLSCCC